jgi:prolyl oligopeptidase
LDFRTSGLQDREYDVRVSEPADTYRWLEDPDSPDTIAWVAEQNRRSEAFLSSIPQRDEIRARLTTLWDYERRSPPSRYGEWFLFSANSGLQPQAVLYKTRSLEQPADVLLDPNGWSAEGTVALAAMRPTEDGRLLAYATSSSGSDWMTWRVREIATGQDLSDEVPWAKFAGAAWAPDSSGFYYAGYAPPADGNVFTSVNTHHVIYFHRLGDLGPDRVVFARPDHPDWLFSADVTEDGRFLVITQSQGTNREHRVFVQDLTVPGSAIAPLLDLGDASYQIVDNDEDVFHVLTDHDAPRGRLVSVRLGHPDAADWTTVIEEATGTDVLSSASRAGDAWVAIWRTDAHERLWVHDLHGPVRREVPLPALGAIVALSSRKADEDVFFQFSSFTYPGTIVRHTVTTGVSTVWHQAPVSFDPAAFETHQVFYPSKDGTRVPMFIVHRRGLVRDGRHRTYLYGYGGFDISLTPAFSPSIVAWMERGGVFAQANIRGGGEYGKAWHDAGRLRHKQNVFDDFIAAAEYLICEGYTQSPRLAIGGGSNGGLLVGACLTQRPDLFGAAVPAVGVLDMLRFHKFTIGWAWTSDYGDPEDPGDRAVLLSYSPLHNIRPGTAYPATLVITADHDDRVAPAHSHKFTATLQDAQAGPAPILSRIDVRAGHGAGKPTAKVIAEKADVWAFLEEVLGRS